MVANARLAGQAGLNFLANGGAKKVAQAGLLRGAAGAVAAPLTGALMAGGAALNFGERLMKGENIVQAAGNTAYDTADFATFGLLKPTVGALGGLGQSLSNTVFGESDEDKINRLTQKVQESEASGNYGGAMVANQELQQVMSNMRSRGSQESSMSLMSSPEYQAQMSVQSANDALMNANNPNNPLGNFQTAGEQARRRSQVFDNDMMRQNAKFALDQSYLADNYKQGFNVANQILQGQQQQIAQRQQGIQQAMTMRY